MSHFSFLLNSHEDLHRKLGFILSYLVSALTTKWGDHLSLLGQFQNEIELLEFLLKKALRPCNIAIECSWKRWVDKLKIYLTAGIVSVIIVKFINVWYLNSLINSTSYGEKFCFSRGNIHCMINCFGNNVLTITYIWNQSCDIIFDTGIRND